MDWVVGNRATRPGGSAASRPERESSIRRGIETLLSLASDQAVENGGLGVTRIAELTGREKSQVSRALATLAEYGLVDRDPETLAYRLGWQIYAIASLAGDQRLLDVSRPRLPRLVADVGERAYVSVLRGSAALTVLSNDAPHAVQVVAWVGRSSSLYATSAGKALLFDHTRDELDAVFRGVQFERLAPNTASDLDQLQAMIERGRKRGYASADEEMEPGLVSVAAPVRDPHNRIVAAVNVSGPKYRLGRNLDRAGRAVIDAARDISDALRGGVTGAQRP
jgi:IclR family transcriptional regulator, KDG regulon repressor